MTEIELRPWHDSEPLPTINLENQNVDNITIPRRYFFIPRGYEFTFPNENVNAMSACEIAAAFEKLKQAESSDDLYPCTEDDLKDVQKLL